MGSSFCLVERVDGAVYRCRCFLSAAQFVAFSTIEERILSENFVATAAFLTSGRRRRRRLGRPDPLWPGAIALRRDAARRFCASSRFFATRPLLLLPLQIPISSFCCCASCLALASFELSMTASAGVEGKRFGVDCFVAGQHGQRLQHVEGHRLTT